MAGVRILTSTPEQRAAAPPVATPAPDARLARATATAPAAPARVFRATAPPTLARKDPPAAGGPQQGGTPEADLAAAREKLKKLVDAQRLEMVETISDRLKTMVAAAPDIAKEPADTYAKRAGEAAQKWSAEAQQQIVDQFAKVANDLATSEIGKGILAELKKLYASINENELARDLLQEFVRLGKEIYKTDAATLAKGMDLPGKAGSLKGFIKLENITSGAFKVIAEMNLVTKGFSATLAYKDGKLEFDLSAALAADATLKGHIDQGGGSITLLLGDHTVTGKVDGSGKGTAEVPEAAQKAALEATVKAAESGVSGFVAFGYQYRKYVTDPKAKKLTQSEAFALRGQLEASAKGLTASLHGEYQSRVVKASVDAVLSMAAGKSELEIRGAIEYVVDKTMSVYFMASVKTGSQGTSGGAEVGVKKGGTSVGIGVYQTPPAGPDGKGTTVIGPTIKGNLQDILPKIKGLTD